MLYFSRARITYNGSIKNLAPNVSNSFEELYLDFKQTNERGGHRWSIFIHPKQDIRIQNLELEFDLPLSEASKMFANGWQTQSESKRIPIKAAIPSLRPIARKRYAFSGDENNANIQKGTGKLHSWTYTYWTQPDSNSVYFLGSLQERSAFTLIQYDALRSTVYVRMDLHDMPLSHSLPALDIWAGFGPLADAVSHYFDLQHLEKLRQIPMFGSQNEGKTSEKALLDRLDKMQASGLPYNAFLLNQGWQNAIGDWKTSNAAFPSGLDALVAQIRRAKFQSGIWLAPFLTEAGSELVQRNPDWLLRDQNGKPLKVGNKMLVLDYYQRGVQDHLSGVFHIILEKWGFDFVKIDQLFAACLAPPPGKSAGQMMAEIMDFLQLQMGERKMMVAAAPLGAVMGRADICDIGADPEFRWKNLIPDYFRHRERNTVPAALHSLLGRYEILHRGFQGLSASFELKTKGSRISQGQQKLWLKTLATLGCSLFSADDPSSYNEAQIQVLREALVVQNADKQTVAPISNNTFMISYEMAGEKAFFEIIPNS